MENINLEKDVALEKDLRVCRYIAYVSGGIGLLILLLFLIFRSFTMAYFGFYYLFFAALINGLAMLLPITLLFTKNEYWKKILITIAIILANIPLGIICAMIGIYLLELQ